MVSITTPSNRDEDYLHSRLQLIWTTFYADVPTGYPITIQFGSPARYRFGSINAKGNQCCIVINRLFANHEVPEYVIDATICHELAHYAHGYGSGLPKRYPFPHRGRVVDIEMRARNCWHIEEKAAAWRKKYWKDFYESHAADASSRRNERERRNIVRWELFLSTPDFRTEDLLAEELERLSAAFGYEDVPFRVEWLKASTRRKGLSYYLGTNNVVRLHCLLADRVVPDEVIHYELSYWLAYIKVGGSWRRVEPAMRQAGVWDKGQRAIRWRRSIWPTYFSRCHPFRSK